MVEANRSIDPDLLKLEGMTNEQRLKTLVGVMDAVTDGHAFKALLYDETHPLFTSALALETRGALWVAAVNGGYSDKVRMINEAQRKADLMSEGF